MLTRVAFGRARFTLPGLTADARGVVAGRDLALRFPTLDRMVSFLRIVSAEACPDEIWAGMRVHHARPTAGMREMLVLVPHTSTHVADVVARAARTAGGQCLTGEGRHFVQYRDREAPAGYDPAVLSHEPADVIFYTLDQTVACRLEGEIPLARVLLRLGLRRVAGPARGVPPAAEGSFWYLTCRRGLGPVFAEYLYRAGVRGDAAVCETPDRGPFSPSSSFWLFRFWDPPRRMLGLLMGTPGLQLYRPVLDRVAVAAGFAHPVHLEGCRAALASGALVFFPPPPGTPLQLAETPVFTALSDLVKLAVPEDEGVAVVAEAHPPQTIDVPLRLGPSSDGVTRPVAAWIPWSQAGWLRRLCYALPSTALAGHRVALLQAGILIVSADRLQGLPFGQLLEEAAPGVLVPVGTRFLPAVSSALIRERLGAAAGTVWVFPRRDGSPFRVADAAFEPLERRVLARAHLAGVVTAELLGDAPADESRAAPEIENESLGLLPVCGARR